jgi:hypothetical protein
MSAQTLGGWENLNCPFFSVICRRTLGPYLESNGFLERGPNEIGGLFYTRFGIFLEVSYELETVPHSLRVILGIGDKVYDKGGHPSGVPYWYLLPRDRPEHEADTTGFSNETQLQNLLTHFRDTVIEPYMKPLWLNLDTLEKAIINFRSEFSC